MIKIGNDKANQLLEHKMPEDDKISPSADSYVFFCRLAPKPSYAFPHYENLDTILVEKTVFLQKYFSAPV